MEQANLTLELDKVKDLLFWALRAYMWVKEPI